MPTTINSTFKKRAQILWGSSQSAVSVRTVEDGRFVRDIEAAMRETEPECVIVIWDRARGFTWDRLDDHGVMKKFPFGEGKEFTSMVAALETIAGLESQKMRKAVFVFLDPHDIFDDPTDGPVCRRVVKTMINDLQLSKPKDLDTGDAGHRRQIIFLSPVVIHRELLEYVVPLDYPRPTEAEHEETVAGVESGTDGKVCSPETRKALAAIGIGLTWVQFENAVAEAVHEHKGFDPAVLDTVEGKKADLISQQGFLTYVPFNRLPHEGDICGFNAVHDFIGMQAQSYTQEDKGLDKPKGMLLMGVAGTGKSMMGKLAARLFYNQTGKRFPVYLLNVPALFAGIVGQTEANVRWVIDTLSAQGHYLLVIDELEKMLATGGYNGDSGVSLRAVGQILTWLAERVNNPNDKGYIIGTLNTTTGIPPEFFRRFDAVFYTDLPSSDVRKEIITSHFKRRGVDINKIVGDDGSKLTSADWDTLVVGTDNFIGSELEDVVIQSRAKAAYDRGATIPNFEEIVKTVSDRGQNIVFKTHRDQIEEVRSYCKDAARPVHVQKVTTISKGSVKRSRQVNTGD
jgi:ATPase family associated with various cellular activities (AAA)